MGIPKWRAKSAYETSIGANNNDAKQAIKQNPKSTTPNFDRIPKRRREGKKELTANESMKKIETSQLIIS